MFVFMCKSTIHLKEILNMTAGAIACIILFNNLNSDILNYTYSSSLHYSCSTEEDERQ